MFVVRLLSDALCMAVGLRAGAIDDIFSGYVREGNAGEMTVRHRGAVYMPRPAPVGGTMAAI